MMQPKTLTCPHAKYNSQMYINCEKIGDMCAHQRWCDGKGWCILTDQAGNCPARRDDINERKAKAAPKRRNKV